MPKRRGDRPAQGRAGVTIPELLVVVTIIGLSVAVAIPLVTSAVRSARVRVAADQYAVTLKAARMVAITQQGPIDLLIAPSPANYFEYTDATGRLRRYDAPPGVRILDSPGTITFSANGSVTIGVPTKFEIDIDDNTVEGWTIDVNLLGVTDVIHYRY
jgi:prepilin-type N-terminal cleavage/methylation domain-containing protein